jgi:GNAT superfamily N-acetyltransferase
VETSCLVTLLLCDFMPEDSIADDHVILVAALNNDSDGSPIIVGMIEISQQTEEPQQTPSPFPLQLGIKKAVASISMGKYELVRWITNLLIAPPHRGQGYLKTLVEACEAVAMSWHCSSIHLHCDANRTTGYVPQKLYHWLGCRLPTLSSHSSPQTPLPYIVEIEGVPLLYLRKSLSDAC